MELGRIQLLSLVTKAITMVLGIVQSIIVVRLLLPSEFGLVGVVMAIGGVIGVSQHLGIVDGAIREIAVRTHKREIAKIFWVSHIVRQIVTLPLSLVLFFCASIIAVRIYGKPEITFFLQLFAASLILQGLQDVLGATLTGMKRFGPLYGIQIVTAAINIVAFGYLTWKYNIEGFFWAVILTTSIMVVLLGYVIMRDLSGNLALPSRQDIRMYGRRVMRVGVYMYAARIGFVVWQRLPLLMLGGVLAADQLGYINASLTFGSRLTILAMALSEVNLAWMSTLFVKKKSEFAHQVTRNMQRVLLLMAAMTLVLIFFAPEILRYVIGPEYLPAERLIIVMTVAFFLYSLVDIGTSSVFVSADRPRLRAIVYGFMTLTSAILMGWLFLTQAAALPATFAVLSGAVIAYIGTILITKKQFHIQLLPTNLVWVIGVVGISATWLLLQPMFWLRSVVFAVLALIMVWQAKKRHILPGIPALVRSVLGSSDAQKRKSLVICFAGAAYDLPYWTNRQHIMTRVSEEYPVLYVEPRVWILRHLVKYARRPAVLLRYLWRLIGYERPKKGLYIVSQWNLIPGSRENTLVASINHWLNRWRIVLLAHILSQGHHKQIVWLYDTEGSEYLSAFPEAYVLYDCVDDHAAQAGVDRNSLRVAEEEKMIMKRANVVTVTSERLFEMKKESHANVHLVLNAGDVALYGKKPHRIPAAFSSIAHPRLGMVGSLDTYKVDVELLQRVARQHPEWNIVLIGEAVVDHSPKALQELAAMSNVHILPAVSHEEAPEYVYQFDICIIPYRSNDYNRASFPLKFWECMATGKPLVVSGLPELQRYKDVVYVASSEEEFITMSEQALHEGELSAAARRATAVGHGWNERAQSLLSFVRQYDA